MYPMINKMGGRLLRPLYDGFYVQININKAKELASYMRSVMEETNISLPTPVDIKIGKNMGELKDEEEF